jgi:hypothetical protein
MADIGLSAASREMLLKVVKDNVALEGNMWERGERTKLGDHDGRSLHQVIMDRTPELECSRFRIGGRLPRG